MCRNLVHFKTTVQCVHFNSALGLPPNKRRGEEMNQMLLALDTLDMLIHFLFKNAFTLSTLLTASLQTHTHTHILLHTHNFYVSTCSTVSILFILGILCSLVNFQTKHALHFSAYLFFISQNRSFNGTLFKQEQERRRKKDKERNGSSWFTHTETLCVLFEC